MSKIIKIGLSVGICLLMIVSMVGVPNATAGEKEQIDMVFGTYLPTKHHIYNNVIVPFVEDVEKRSDGLIKMDIKSGGSIGGSDEIIHNIGKGIVDIGQSYAVYHGSILPYTNITTLPGILENSVVGSLAINEMVKEVPEIQKEWSQQNVYPLALAVAGGRGFMSNTAFREIDDADGLRVQVSGKNYALIWKELGARPVVGSSGEIYQNIQKGAVDGASASWASLPGYSLQEITEYATHVPWGYSPFYLVINNKRWENLPSWAKDVLRESAKKVPKMVGQSYEDRSKEASEIFEESGVEEINLPSDQIEQITERLEPMHEEWIQDRSNPERAHEILTLFKEKVEKYRK